MISSNVSRLTLNGMFLMTIAVGMTSSSRPPWPIPGVITWPPMTGESPEDEMSELLLGDRERLSGMVTELSSQC